MTDILVVPGTPFKYENKWWHDVYPIDYRRKYYRDRKNHLANDFLDVSIKILPPKNGKLLSLSKRYIVKGNYGRKVGMFKFSSIRNDIIPHLEKIYDISNIYVLVDARDADGPMQWVKLLDCRIYNTNYPDTIKINPFFFWTLTHD